MMTSAERDYFDPRDPEPRCDICDEPMDRGDDPEPWLDWNSETGNHLTCEERQKDEEDEPFRPGCLLCGGPCEKVEQHWRSDFGHPES